MNWFSDWSHFSLALIDIVAEVKSTIVNETALLKWLRNNGSLQVDPTVFVQSNKFGTWTVTINENESRNGYENILKSDYTCSHR